MSIKHEMVIRRLQRGEEVLYKESGNSMHPTIKHRQPVKLSPVDTSKLGRGDIVLARVRGNFLLHYVSAVEKDRVQIASKKKVNGKTPKTQVYGIVTEIDGRRIKNAERKILKN